MKIKTAVTDMLGIDLPIIGAPMFLVSYPDLVTAVSNAGGIGTFPALNYRSKEELRDGLTEIREKTDKPIGVNLILLQRHNPNWREQFEMCLEFKIELIITSLGSPRSIIKEAKSVGAKVFCDVTTMKHARIVVKSDADALIAVAQGAGGHAGTISPFSLIPYLKEEFDVPVIAAGSIGTGQQMAAALSLGADAVYVGTKLIASNEAAAQNEYKTMLVDSAPEDIVYTEKISGIPANWLKRSVEKVELSEGGVDTGLNDEYKRWKDIWSAGHGVGQIKEVKSAGGIIKQMVDDYLKTVKAMPTS